MALYFSSSASLVASFATGLSAGLTRVVLVTALPQPQEISASVTAIRQPTIRFIFQSAHHALFLVIIAAARCIRRTPAAPAARAESPRWPTTFRSAASPSHPPARTLRRTCIAHTLVDTHRARAGKARAQAQRRRTPPPLPLAHQTFLSRSVQTIAAISPSSAARSPGSAPPPRETQSPASCRIRARVRDG